MKRILFIFALVATTISSNAWNLCADGIYYDLNYETHEATVTYPVYGHKDYINSLSGTIVIPEKVTIEEGEFVVTNIGDMAFWLCSNITSVEIPNTVISIGQNAFSHCDGLKKITLGNSVKSIGESAFWGCPIQSIVIPNSVISIENTAFCGCESLETVIMGNSVKTIGESAFNNCNQLNSITLPNSLVSIGDYAFYYCSSLKDIVFGNSIISIGEGAFSDCSLITSIEIPGSVMSIGSAAFASCARLKSLIVDEKNINFISKDNVLFNQNQTEIICCAGGKNGSYIIPSSVKNIDNFSFSSCQLSTIVIPNSVSNIGIRAFQNCTIKDIFCYAEEIPETSTDAFEGFPIYISAATLHVPFKALNDYKNTEPWSKFGSIHAISIDKNLSDGNTFINIEEKEYDELTYTRTFSEQLTNKWNAMYVPMSINVEDYLEDFDFAEIYTVCPNEDTNGDGTIDGNDDNKLIVNKLKTGTTQPNMPYLIRPKAAGTYTIASADNILYPSEENSFSCSTMTDEYTFKGSYSTTNVIGDKLYYMNIDGILDYSPSASIAVKPNRWIMEVRSKIGNTSSSSRSKAMSISVIGEDTKAAGIESIDASRNVADTYNLNGIKMNNSNLPAGIYIKNGKKLLVK